VVIDGALTFARRALLLELGLDGLVELLGIDAVLFQHFVGDGFELLGVLGAGAFQGVVDLRLEIGGLLIA
jgi:hypothetical protein